MWRAFALLAPCIALGIPASNAQVDDPLYPLEVGAVSEFEFLVMYPTGGATYMLHRERREVVGDTVLAGETFRIVRVLRATGRATSWDPWARCAVRIDRAAGTPTIDWIAISGECEPHEQGMALANVESGSFNVTVVGDTVAFARGIRHSPGTGSWALVEGIGPHLMGVYNSNGPVPRFETTVMTHVRTGAIDAGRSYEPGWWHYLVRLNPGDQYQYEEYLAQFYNSTTTFERWLVIADTVIGGAPMVLVEQSEYSANDGSLMRESLCALEKRADGVSTLTLQGGACTGISTGEVWWFSHLRDVEAVGGVYPGSYNFSGTWNNYRQSVFAEPLGYVLFKDISHQGSGGSARTHTFTLRYAVVDGVTFGSPVVAVEPEPVSAGSEFRVLPNPFNSTLTLYLARARTAVAEVEIFDVVGRRVLRTEIVVPGTQQVDLSALAPGVYVIRALLDDGTVLTRTATKAR